MRNLSPEEAIARARQIASALDLGGSDDPSAAVQRFLVEIGPLIRDHDDLERLRCALRLEADLGSGDLGYAHAAFFKFLTAELDRMIAGHGRL
jgi:hypothetical protein